MELYVKRFDELNTRELYEILRARSEIFIVEQKRYYQDVDGDDYRSLHFFFIENGKVTAYLRACPCDNGDTVHVSRVLTTVHMNGLGRALLEKSIPEIKKRMDCRCIRLNAQKYAARFYEKFNFKIISEEFTDRDIVHVTMELLV